MSREIANPFDNTIHDTPMTALSRTIELNLREQMQNDQRPLPQPIPWPQLRDVQPVDGFVF
jgi:putative membrane protein